jgi:hypothetical protein
VKIRKLFFCLIIFLSSILNFIECKAQNGQAQIRQAAFEMGKALIGKNSETFITYMHPTMILLAGGKEKLRVIADSALTVFEQFGGRISKINYGNPSEIIEHKKMLQSVLPQSTFLTSPFGDVELSSSLIAISKDNGKSWKFIDTNLFSIGKIKAIMPDISPKLVIPKQQAPKFTQKE